MKQRSLLIIHFQPIERFPPVINLLNFLRTHANEKVITISTLNKSGNKLTAYRSKTANVKIKRTPAIQPHSVYRVANYLLFYLNSFYLLLKHTPVSVLYFDTLSSWPALIYKKFRGNKVKLMVHYHEYTSPESYLKNMRLVKWMHKLESKMYPVAYEWISHTNEIRLEKFKTDHSLELNNPDILYTMSNYPSVSWTQYKTEFGEQNKFRLVYVGSLGYDNMYLKETVDWVLLNKKKFSLHFYAYNIDKKAKDFLFSVDDNCIQYFGGCNYEDLPSILENYDVGLVMYKPFSYNTVNAVSNKVFEYLACGLDVWFSKDMTYTFSFIREKTYPKILAVDFSNLNTFDFNSALKREGLPHQPSTYFYEDVYTEVYKKMK